MAAHTSATNNSSMQWYPEKVALQVCLEEDLFREVWAGRDEIMLHLAGTW
jgi:hypothetical protein